MEVQKNDKGHVRYAVDIKTMLPNGYTLTVNPVSIDEDGCIDDIDFWATEENILKTHSAFSRYIKDFGIPHKGLAVIDIDGEICTVNKVFVHYSNSEPKIEVQFT